MLCVKRRESDGGRARQWLVWEIYYGTWRYLLMKMDVGVSEVEKALGLALMMYIELLLRVVKPCGELEVLC